MMRMTQRKETVKTDVLVVGGGIGGLQAAIAAASTGVGVVVAEKANTRRSGCGATGNDHFMCYIPEYHGDDFDMILREVGETLVGPNQDMNLFALMMRRSLELVQKWESYGIDMRPTGKWNFEGHSMPNRRRYHLKFDGHKQKPLLTAEAKKQGAAIMNHVMITEFLTNAEGRLTGALGIDTSHDAPELIVFEAKAAIITTGANARLYPGRNPAYVCNTGACPATGGGVIAYRAGARMVNLDLPYKHAGPRLFERFGKATWIGVLTDLYGKPVGPFVTKPTRELGDVTSDIWQDVFDQKMADGSGPVFMNCSQTSDADIQHMHRSFFSEGDSSINDYLEQYGIDLHTDMIEFGAYSGGGGKGLDIDINGSTTLPGLYACGDIVGNVRGDITSAAVFGQICGESACAYANQVAAERVAAHPLIAEKLAQYNEILGRESDANWNEANTTLTHIMDTYVSVVNVRSETLLLCAIKYLGDLRRYSQAQLGAKNAHELMRVLEVLDLIQSGEVTARCAQNRKETRGFHVRKDYPFTNPLMNNKFQTVRMAPDGTAILEFRDKVHRYE